MPMEPLVYTTQYAQILSQAYASSLHFGALHARDQEGDYKFTGAATVSIPSITTGGRVDDDRNEIGNASRDYQNYKKDYTMRFPRKWKILVDPLDIDETAGVVNIRNITKVFNETQKFPEIDKYTASTLFNDWMNDFSRIPLSGRLTVENILEYIDTMSECMTEHNVPLFGRILYCPPFVERILKNARDFYKTLDLKNQSEAVQRRITNLDNIQIEAHVPSEFMLTSYNFTKGATRGVSAKQIAMILVHPSSVITPKKYEACRIDPPTAASDDKYVYFERSVEDVFILPNKQYGVEFVVYDMELSTATFTTAASSASGSVAGDCKITVTAPIGANLLPGSRYFYKSATGTAPELPEYGTAMTNADGWVEWDGVSVVNIPNSRKLSFVVADIDGRAYSAGSGTVTSKT